MEVAQASASIRISGVSCCGWSFFRMFWTICGARGSLQFLKIIFYNILDLWLSRQKYFLKSKFQQYFDAFPNILADIPWVGSFNFPKLSRFKNVLKFKCLSSSFITNSTESVAHQSYIEMSLIGGICVRLLLSTQSMSSLCRLQI